MKKEVYTTTLPYRKPEKVIRETVKKETSLEGTTLDPMAGFPSVNIKDLDFYRSKYELPLMTYKKYTSKAKVPESIKWDWKMSENGEYKVDDYKNLVTTLGLQGPIKKRKADYIEYVQANKNKIKEMLK